VVIDDGRGFSPKELHSRQQDGHLGLSLLHERVAEAGATITIVSAPGGGTTIRLQLARS
jgi:signal transduction histidine kinase